MIVAVFSLPDFLIRYCEFLCVVTEQNPFVVVVRKDVVCLGRASF